MIGDPGMSREEALPAVGEQAIRLGEKVLTELNQLKASLHEEFYICGAAGYPDPYRCYTFEDARRFALDHGFNHSAQTKVEVTIRRRLVSENEVVWMNELAAKAAHAK